MKLQLSLDYFRAKKLIKKSSKTFYKAFSKFTDRNQRNAVYSIYAFCRKSDDLADKSKNLEKLLYFENQLIEFVKNESAPNFIFRSLLDVKTKFYAENYDFKPYFDMIEGQKMDFKINRYETLESLYTYCMNVASSVGEMLIPILDKNDKNHAHEFVVAKHLGIAMQLTNILRDIGEDFENNRIYIPKEILDLFNYTENDLKNQVIDQRFIDMFDYIAKITETHYQKAFENIKYFPKESKKILLAASFLYKEIINVCKENNYDVFSKKNYVDNNRKLEIIKELERKL